MNQLFSPQYGCSFAFPCQSFSFVKNLLHYPDRELQDSAVNYFQKKKTGKEMQMNIQIGDYKFDSFILDLGSYVNILIK